MNGTVCYAGQDDEIEERLRNCLVKAGVYEADEEEEPSDFFSKFSLWIYDNYGTAGFSQMPLLSLGLIADGIVAIFAEYIITPISRLFTAI